MSHDGNRGVLVVACGLAAEAKIAAGGDDVRVIAGGGDQARLVAELEAWAPSARGFLSFGVAGGLAPNLRPGDLQVAEAVLDPEGHLFETDASWTSILADTLHVRRSLFATVETPLADVAGKAALYRATSAATVDMESHLVARIARDHGRPFAAIRAVTDPADRALPHAASVGMRADGKVDLAAILSSLARQPGQLPGLIRTGLDARAAFASLLRCRQRLGPRFALLDIGEPGLNMP